MSFEGTYQILCRNGHQFAEDVYVFDEDMSVCPTCGEEPIWVNLIDETNGEGIVINLKVKEECEYCKCDKCNDIHIKKAQTYYVPEDGGQLVNQFKME